MRKINIPASFGRIPETWFPHLAGRANGQEIRLARIEGRFDWHRHDDADEAFFVVKGRFVMRLRDGDIAMEEGDLLVVPAGVEHRPDAAEECWIMMIEKAGTLNTGDRETARTRRTTPEL